MRLKTLSPDGVTNPQSPLFHVKKWKMWKMRKNVIKCVNIVEKCAENVEQMCGNVENVGNVGKRVTIVENVEKV